MYRVLIDNWQVVIVSAICLWIWLHFIIILEAPADRFRGDIKYKTLKKEEEDTI